MRKIFDSRVKLPVFMGGIAVAALIPKFVDEYWMQILIFCLIYIIACEGYNLILGFAGQFAICHSSFFTIGAYASAILNSRFGLSFWFCLPVACLLATILGILISLVVARMRGAYLCIVTIGFAAIVSEILLNWISLTGGGDGIGGISRPSIKFLNLFALSFVTKSSYYYLVLVATIGTLAIVWRVVNSRVGIAFVSIRDDEIAAKLMGINVPLYKVLAFALSAFFGGGCRSSLCSLPWTCDARDFQFLANGRVAANNCYWWFR